MAYLKQVPRFLLVLILIGVIMAGIGQAYQEHAELIDLSRFSPRGKLFSIRDQLTGKEYRLHLYCAGDHKPHMPTVILINGAGDNSLIWSLVQPHVSETYRVCSYDRAGYGWSDPGPGARSAYQNANELHALLSEAGIEPPYVLAAHSIGGLTARRYAKQFKDEVAGVVMVDSSNADELADLAPWIRHLGLRIPLVETKACEIAASVGLYRLLTELNVLSPNRIISKLPTELQPEAQALRLRAELCKTLYGEQAAMINDIVQLHRDGDLGALPVIAMIPVLSATDRANVVAQQTYWSRLSSQVETVVIENSGHYLHLDQPDAVIHAILEMATKMQK